MSASVKPDSKGKREPWWVMALVVAPPIVAMQVGPAGIAVLGIACLSVQLGYLVYFGKALLTWVASLRRSATTTGLVKAVLPEGTSSGQAFPARHVVRFTTADGRETEMAARSLGFKVALGDITGVRYDRRSGAAIHLTGRERLAAVVAAGFFCFLTVCNAGWIAFLVFYFD